MSITAIICHPQPRPTTVFLPADASPVPADTSGTCDMCLKGQHMEASCSIIQHPTICSHQHEVCAGLVQQARDCSVVLSPASTSWLFFPLKTMFVIFPCPSLSTMLLANSIPGLQSWLQLGGLPATAELPSPTWPSLFAMTNSHEGSAWAWQHDVVVQVI